MIIFTPWNTRIYEKYENFTTRKRLKNKTLLKK